MIDARDVQVPNYFRAFIAERFGEMGRGWLDAIPSIVARYAEVWDLVVQPPFDGLSYNYVAPVRRRDGTEAVLKVGLPEREQRAEIYALRAFDGRGIIAIFDSNVDDHVALIERLRPGVMLSTLFPDRDDRATEIAAGLMNELIIPAPADRTEFIRLEGWFTRGLEGLRREFDGGTGPFPRPLVERAEALFRDLQASTNQKSLIHGDLHHMNILSSDAHGGWRAIDPKGVIADRAYEPAPFILNPNYAINSTPHLKALFARRIDRFSEIMGIDRYRIHGWTLAFTVLSAWWGYGTSERWQQTIALGEELAEI